MFPTWYISSQLGKAVAPTWYISSQLGKAVAPAWYISCQLGKAVTLRTNSITQYTMIRQRFKIIVKMTTLNQKPHIYVNVQMRPNKN